MWIAQKGKTNSKWEVMDFYTKEVKIHSIPKYTAEELCRLHNGEKGYE